MTPKSPRLVTAALTGTLALAPPTLAAPASAAETPAKATTAAAASASRASASRASTARASTARASTARAAGVRAAGVRAAGVRAAGVRVIRVNGANNVRDLGGYTAGNGRHVRYGLVYRSASLSKVTPAGVAALGRLRLSAAVDFRSQGEVSGDGTDRLPKGVTPVAAPINPASTTLLSLPADLLKALLAENKAAGFMELSYRGFIHDPASRKQFAGALRRIAAGKGAVLYHCTAGKDRTGTMSAILLTTLGVNKKQVYADYLRSNRELAASNAAQLAKLKKYGIDPALVSPLLTVQASYLDAAFDQIKRDYGTFDAFLGKGLGIDAATKAKLRHRLLK
ncbi:tyrosine-protein phosphatase [Actinomadura barringtoniae]|uniref:Tyrosine-protein phosphatase n=1 Tax=Actinomadura barringtoniae TaxID=1427535 RepID=A0A939PIT0_9ACTN|nr:tyrosine-protein phosphatase [Actinomadura barringtoniae]MBO2449326.1 tyrosine-protein phosphatase [Actinomadura barringtoniae]